MGVGEGRWRPVRVSEGAPLYARAVTKVFVTALEGDLVRAITTSTLGGHFELDLHGGSVACV